MRIRSTSSSRLGSRMLQVNVARLHDDNREALSLAWLAGREGGTAVPREGAAAGSLLGRLTRAAPHTPHAVAATAVGHLNLPLPTSSRVIGAYEAPNVTAHLERLFDGRPAAVILADGVGAPAELVDAAVRTHTPLFASPLPAPRVIEHLARYL